MRVRLTHIDGKLPNLALMKLSSFHRAQGDEVVFTKELEKSSLEPEYDRVYGSSIFTFSQDRIARLKNSWPSAVLGGTGTTSWITVEDILGQKWKGLDYSLYPEFLHSIGFTQRGCRLSCKFCVVPQKEGKPRQSATIYEIWRGKPWPKKIHLLDNDFFGQPKDQWQMRLQEIREGNFKVCFNQGINIRMIDEESAAGIASIQYRDDQFQRRRLYTAWDNLRDEKIFLRGVETLRRYGIPPKHLMVYMLVGFDIEETWERIFHRFNTMVSLGVLPYPMVYDRKRKDLREFQRWAVTGLYRAVKWENYDAHYKIH